MTPLTSRSVLHESVGSQNPVLRVRGLHMHFGDMRVIDGVDLTANPGELVAIVGENGAGKSTLMRCIVGDLSPTAGSAYLCGHKVGSRRRGRAHPGVGVVWQTVAQCDNLDVASNLLLGRETRRMLRSETAMHTAAGAILADLEIPIDDTARLMGSLPRGQQQLVAVARAVQGDPALLVLDEPTGSLGVRESALVERLVTRLHRSGRTIILVSHDIPQLLRLADRIVVLRHGRVVAEVDPATAHPDDIAALVAGQHVDSSARRQLSRLQDLVDRLASIDASSGLPLVVTALAAALRVDRLCLHRVQGQDLVSAWTLGLPDDAREFLSVLPFGQGGGPTGIAAASGQTSLDLDGTQRNAAGWPLFVDDTRPRACYAVPVIGSAELLGVLTVFRKEPGAPKRDELDLVGLYAGYVAAVIERQQADEARQEATALRRSHDLQRQFLGRLSHELRTPLTAIRGYASSLAQPDVEWDSASTGRFVTRISEESDRLGRLVGDLLDFSAIESGVMRLNLDWCDLALVVRAAHACLPPDAAERVTIDGHPTISVWGDHDRLEQVFVNVLDNAVRHNPPDTRVTVRFAAVPGGVEVTVLDDGVGLPEGVTVGATIPASKRRATSGSGLGLSISRGIVEAHRGSFGLERLRHGTALHVTLPEDMRSLDSREDNP